MRRKNVDVQKDLASELFQAFMQGLADLGISLSIDGQLLLLQRAKAVIEGNDDGKGGDG